MLGGRIPIEDDWSNREAGARSPSGVSAQQLTARPPSSTATAKRQPPSEQPVVLLNNQSQVKRASFAAANGPGTAKRASARLLPERLKPAVVESFAAPDLVAPNYDLKLLRKELSDVQNMMGTAVRSDVTGLVFFRGPQIAIDSNFTLVDFWTRYTITGLPPQLQKDVYIFRPIPMLYRTWIYHSMYKEGLVLTSDEKHRDIDGMLKHVLASHCIDVNVSAGRWSSTMCYGPVALAVSFAGNMDFTIVACVVLVLLEFVGKLMNHPAAYRYTRPVTLPLRLGFFLYACITMPGNLRVVVAHVLALCCALVDFIWGDLMMLMQYRHTCSYQVLRILGQGVYICRRHGAATSRFYQSRPSVDEYVSGIGAWDNSMAIITDVQGLVMMLEPVQRDHWEMLQDQAHSSTTPIYFLGLDLYNEQRSSAFAGLDSARTEKPPTPKNTKDAGDQDLSKRAWDSFVRRAEAFIMPVTGSVGQADDSRV